MEMFSLERLKGKRQFQKCRSNVEGGLNYKAEKFLEFKGLG